MAAAWSSLWWMMTHQLVAATLFLELLQASFELVSPLNNDGALVDLKLIARWFAVFADYQVGSNWWDLKSFLCYLLIFKQHVNGELRIISKLTCLSPGWDIGNYCCCCCLYQVRLVESSYFSPQSDSVLRCFCKYGLWRYCSVRRLVDSPSCLCRWLWRESLMLLLLSVELGNETREMIHETREKEILILKIVDVVMRWDRSKPRSRWDAALVTSEYIQGISEREKEEKAD